MLVGMDRCFLGVAIAGVSYLLTPSHKGLSKNVELFGQSRVLLLYHSHTSKLLSFVSQLWPDSSVNI